MKRVYLLLLVTMFFVNCKQTGKTEQVMEPKGAENIAYKWSQMAITATANDTEKFKPRPTITSRFLGLIFVSVFDAWSRYDEKAIPVYLEGVDRRPKEEQTLRNKEIAISYAAFRAMNEYYFSDKDLFANFMVELGMDPNNQSLDPTTPEDKSTHRGLMFLSFTGEDGDRFTVA